MGIDCCLSSLLLYLWAQQSAGHRCLVKVYWMNVSVCLIHLCLTLVVPSLLNENILYAVSIISCPQSPYVPRFWLSMLLLEFHLIRHTPASIHFGLALFSVVTSSVLWSEKHQYPKLVQESSWEQKAGSWIFLIPKALEAVAPNLTTYRLRGHHFIYTLFILLCQNGKFSCLLIFQCL